MPPAVMHVPIAEPRVPKAGIGPTPTIRTTLSARFTTVITMPRRIGVRASPAERNAPPSMKNTIMPLEHTNMIRRNGSACAATSGRAWTNSRSHGAAKYPTGAMTPRQAKRHEEGLIHHAVDLLRLPRPGEACDEHAHAGEDRRHEHDHDQEDLPAHPDRRVGLIADQIADEDLIDHPLHATDGIRHHRRPRDLPDRGTERSFDNRAVVARGDFGHSAHRNRR